MRNLLTNAIKFSSENLNISITTLTNIEGVTNINVKDSGISMTAAKIEIFYAIKTETSTGTLGEKGSGLGLFLVKELLAKANASLSIKSNIGKGSKFIISLG